MASEFLLVVEQERLALAAHGDGECLLLAGVPVLDLVAQRNEELEIGPHRVGLVGPAMPHASG
nr:hypothetical protein [Amycolatopsis sp. WAC 04197]